MAKQTFTTGQVLTAAQMTSLQQTAMLGGDTTAKTTSYTLVAADAGTVVAMNSSGSTTITVNTSIFSAGDIVTIQNRGSGTCTVTAGTATVNTSGSLVLAQYQGGVLYFNSASAAVFYQFATPASGDIEGVTAGTGISGGGTSGTVTITNSMATAIDAKGDLIVGTGADTFSRLAVGTNDYVLTAASGETTGVKWAAVNASSLTLLSTTTLSGTTNITSIDQGYKNLVIDIQNPNAGSGTAFIMILYCNQDTSAGNHFHSGHYANTMSSSNSIYYIHGNVSQKYADGPSITIRIENYSKNDWGKVIQSAGWFLDTSDVRRGFQIGGGYIDNYTAITSLRFDTSGGSFTGGTVKIYGEK